MNNVQDDMELQRLLQQADAQALYPPSDLGTDTARKAMTCAAGRRRRRHAAVSGVLAIIAVAAWLILQRGFMLKMTASHAASRMAATPTAPPALAPASIDALIAQRAAEIVVDDAAACRKAHHRATHMTSDDLGATREEVAAIMLQHAEVHQRDAQMDKHASDDAAALYAETIDLFPRTAAAKNAQAALQKLRAVD